VRPQKRLGPFSRGGVHTDLVLLAHHDVLVDFKLSTERVQLLVQLFDPGLTLLALLLAAWAFATENGGELDRGSEKRHEREVIGVFAKVMEE